MLNLDGVYHEKSVDTLRLRSMRTELSYSRYNRQVIASGSAVPNFRSILMLPLVGCDACPSDAVRSGERTYNIMKKPFIYILCVIWSPEFEW